MSGYKFRGEDVSNLIKYRDIEIQKCISCNSKKFKEFSNSKFFPSVKCCNCGLIWMQPSFSEKGLQKYYSDYIGRRRVNNKEKMEQRQEQYKIDIEFIQRHVSEGLMLDIGCSGGFFLNGFSEKFEKHGIEIDQNAVDFANKNFDNLSGKVSCTNLEDYNTNLNFDSFDVTHGMIKATGFVFDKIAYISDCNKISNKALKKLKNLNFLKN